MEWLASLCLFFTLFHTLNAGRFQRLSERYSHQRFAHLTFHLLAEVEFIFGFWAILYLLLCGIFGSFSETIPFLSQLHFSESVFVVVVMIAAATAPILNTTQKLIEAFSRQLPLPQSLATSKVPELFSILVIAPLLGSLITEPAAMTVAALLIHQQILGTKPSQKLLYSTLGTLFVNVSIGGILTSFAAPPVLMVARIWNWDSHFMFTHFGWKAIIAVILNSAILCRINLKELKSPHLQEHHRKLSVNPLVLMMNLGFLIITILNVHHIGVLALIFIALMIYLKLTKKHQGTLRLQSSFFVGFFLAGLTVLTAEQGWWLKPVLTQFGENALFIGSTLLTAITDNAALTSLAAQVDQLTPLARYLVVAGAVTGGGLTLIANAPNPAGFSILKERFGKEGLRPATLLKYAMIPTLIAGALLWNH